MSGPTRADCSCGFFVVGPDAEAMVALHPGSAHHDGMIAERAVRIERERIQHGHRNDTDSRYVARHDYPSGRPDDPNRTKSHTHKNGRHIHGHDHRLYEPPA